jgi:SPP1 family predicted phage head-tail adaptor
MATQLKTDRYQPYQFRKIADFGAIKSVSDPQTGVNVPTFVKQFRLHYAPIKRTLTQQYELVGTELQDTIIIAIRHNKDVQESMQVQIKDMAYTILNLSLDESNSYITYDFLTLKKVKRGGGSGI